MRLQLLAMLVCHYKETIIHVHQGIQIIGVIFQYFPQAFMHERIYEAEFIEKGDGKFCEKVDNDFPIFAGFQVDTLLDRLLGNPHRR